MLYVGKISGASSIDLERVTVGVYTITLSSEGNRPNSSLGHDSTMAESHAANDVGPQCSAKGVAAWSQSSMYVASQNLKRREAERGTGIVPDDWGFRNRMSTIPSSRPSTQYEY